MGRAGAGGGRRGREVGGVILGEGEGGSPRGEEGLLAGPA